MIVPSFGAVVFFVEFPRLGLLGDLGLLVLARGRLCFLLPF